MSINKYFLREWNTVSGAILPSLQLICSSGLKMYCARSGKAEVQLGKEHFVSPLPVEC